MQNKLEVHIKPTPNKQDPKQNIVCTTVCALQNVIISIVCEMKKSNKAAPATNIIKKEGWNGVPH
jgi:hypothetical protein